MCTEEHICEPKSLNSPLFPREVIFSSCFRAEEKEDILALKIGDTTRKVAAVLLIAALFAPYFISVGFPMRAAAQAEAPVIVFDMGHGQYKDTVFEYEDMLLEGNLTEMGFEVVWAWGGLNATILDGAWGLVIGSIYGSSNGFAASEITAVETWFADGEKFLWVSYDSDYAGYDYIRTNSTAMLEAAESSVYGEPISVSDAISNCQASYRVVANKTSTAAAVSTIVAGVDAVLMHGPTCLYGVNSTDDPVALETVTLPNVHPVLYYGASATIGDSDLVPPLAHTDGQSGEFVAMTVETNAGPTDNSIIVVSGASPYGDYQPMSTAEYYNVTLTGFNLVYQTFEWGKNRLMGGFAIDPILLIGIVGVVVVVIIIAVVARRWWTRSTLSLLFFSVPSPLSACHKTFIGYKLKLGHLRQE
jgi:hypothetical protein